MRAHIILIPLLVGLSASGCQQVECAEGTIERDGKCEPSDNATNNGICGPFTELQGDRCVPTFPPTQCDPATTEADVDPATGVTTCIGTGTGGGCAAPLACPTPTGATRQTICGQIYDFERAMTPFAATGAMGVKCDPMNPTTSGPCALQIGAYDAIAFATNPMTAQPLPVGNVYIDDCGRYRVSEIETNGTGPFIGLGFDDAGGPIGNPMGVTVTAAVTTSKQVMTATRDLEAFIVHGATAGMWQASGGPPLSGGIYALVFRQHKDPARYEAQAGVTVTKMGNTIPANDFYFPAALLDRTTIDAAATATGMNGTALVTNASVADSVSYAGTGGLGAGCRWEFHAGASLAGIVYIQVYRKADIIGQTCND